MEYINTDDFIFDKPTVVTTGNFDGLHAGHRQLIKTVKSESLTTGAAAVVFSFFPHPTAVLNSGNQYVKDFKTIITKEEKIFLLGEMGIDYYIEFPFTLNFADKSPEWFLSEIIYKKLNCKTLVIGEGYRFGKKKSGDSQTAERICNELGFKVLVVPHIGETEKISSSDIRALIRQKELVKAAELLCRPFFITGTVVRGRGIGEKMGFPTVNITVDENKLLPPDGVYITKTFYCGKFYKSVTNIGSRPTIQPELSEKVIETFLFDFNGVLYDEILRIDFIKWIRGEIKFGNLDELKRRIDNDVCIAGEFFSGKG